MNQQIEQDIQQIVFQLREVRRKVILQRVVVDKIIGGSAPGTDKSIEDKLAGAVNCIDKAADILQHM